MSATTREEVLIPLLARRSYHLPGNGWFGDWIQWMRNNHILFGICFHHKIHPVEWWERIMAMVGSVAFGLFATNFAYLWDHYDPNSMDDILYTLEWNNSEYVITKGTAALWTLGGICHSIFDFFLWNVMACACCHPGGRFAQHKWAERCNDCGSYLMMPFVLGFAFLATYACMLRANSTNEDLQQDEDDVYEQYGEILGSFSFLTEYIIEIVLAWFFYFPIFGTVMFSGILGCGRLPVLGGRPKDKRTFEQEMAEGRYFAKC